MNPDHVHVIESRSLRRGGASARHSTTPPGLQTFQPSRQGSVTWRDTIIVTKDGVFLMAVAIGPDGRVWSYRSADAVTADSQDDDWDLFGDELGSTNPSLLQQLATVPGMRMTCTQMQADTISMGFDSEGRPVVFGARDLSVDYVVCINLSSMLWSKPKAAHIELPDRASHVAQIFTRRIAGQLHVGAMTHVMAEDGTASFNAVYANWDLSGADFRHTPVSLQSLDQATPEQVLQSAAASSFGAMSSRAH